MTISSGAARTAVRALLFLALSAPAFADWHLCNHTNDSVVAAVAFDNGQGYVSRGWYKIAACGCSTVYQGMPLRRGAFFHVHSVDGSMTWEGDNLFCVDPAKRFLLSGPANSVRGACEKQGFTKKGFLAATLTGNDFTTNLNSPGRVCHTL